MDVTNSLLLWMHLIGLALGGAASFGIPVAASRIPTAAAEVRPLLMGIAKGLSTVGRAGLVLTIATGLLMAWLNFGWSGLTVWFYVKMALVVLLVAGVVYSGILMKRASGGDAAAAQRAPMVGMFNTAMLVLTVLAAVFAFN